MKLYFKLYGTVYNFIFLKLNIYVDSLNFKANEN